MARKRRWLLVLISLVTVTFAYEGFAQRSASAPRSATTDPIPVFQCRTILVDKVELASDITGTIKSLSADEGEAIEEGEVVVRLKDEIAAAALATAEKRASDETELKYARKANELAEVEYAKSLDLYKKGAIVEMDLRRSKLDAERSFLQIERAQSELDINSLERDQRQAELEAYYIEAPWSGIVTRVFKRPGAAVRQGDAILEMVSTDRLRVEGFVDISDAARIQRGDRVEIRVDPSYGGSADAEPIEARVGFMDPSVESTSRMVRIWAEVTDHSDRLRPGVLALMTIYPGTADDRKAVQQ